MSRTVARGDFTSLAASYKNRPGYSELVLNSLRALTGKPASALAVAEVGAGTGKLTELLLRLGLTVTAVEPNDAMRAEGERAVTGAVTWRKGSGEDTGLPAGAFDWVLMASSFHWVDLEKGLREFHRILRPGGMFTALWNPRDLERSPWQQRIDQMVKSMVPNLTRVSSGGKAHGADWFERLASTRYFGDVLFLEAKHDVNMTPERYLGAWESVNDIQSQCTPQQWRAILDAIAREVKGMDKITVPYATRAWTVWRKP